MRFLFLLAIPLIVLAKYDYQYLTEYDILNFSQEQLEVLNTSYKVGNHYSIEPEMGFLLAAIAYTENNAKMKDNNQNRICGPHQVDVIENKVSCEALESNPFTSAISALRNLEFWQYQNGTDGKIIRERTIEERIRMYNVGYTNHEHQWEYLYKVEINKFVLEFYQHIWLKE